MEDETTEEDDDVDIVGKRVDWAHWGRSIEKHLSNSRETLLLLLLLWRV